MPAGRRVPLQLLWLPGAALLRKARHRLSPEMHASVNLGFVVIAGHRLPITSVRLSGGAIRLEYLLQGPLPAMAGHVTVFGADGRGIWQGHEARYPEIEAGRSWVCQYDIRLTKVDTYDTVADWTDHMT